MFRTVLPVGCPRNLLGIYFADNIAIFVANTREKNINVFTLFDFSLLFCHSAYECSKYPEIFSQIFTFFCTGLEEEKTTLQKQPSSSS
jgi:hypothetical protein